MFQKLERVGSWARELAQEYVERVLVRYLEQYVPEPRLLLKTMSETGTLIGESPVLSCAVSSPTFVLGDVQTQAT